jgi:hypothetical protein
MPVNRLKKKFLFLFLFFYSVSYAQQFGGNPPSIKWKQVNSPAARIIFPQQMDSSAERISNIISYLSKTTQNTIGTKQRKINLVLQNQTTISNAYVSLGPFRSEFFLTPLQNSFELGSLPWNDQLAIHEFRHVQQYNNFNVGLSHLLRILFGEEGQALANNAAIPNWFFEGDAVFNETNVSMQGRGRLPFFYKDYRSLWLADKKYSWMKLRNGSYKDFIPDHYALGYLLVAYGREKYGDDFWKNVTHDAAAFKGLFYPFQKAIKKYSGKNYIEFKNDAFTYFKNKLEENNQIAPAHKQFVNQEFPSFTEGNTIVYVRSDYKHIPAFIIKNGNSEKRIRVRDVSIDNYFSYRNGKIVYASYQPDIRWGYSDYSDLRILDVTTGNQRSITKHTKYFSPDISNDGNTIVAVQVSPNGKSKFYGDKIISAVRNTSGQMSMAVINVNGNVEYLTPFSFNVIGYPTVFNDTIYFSAAHEKEDNLYALAIPNQKIFSLRSAISKNGIGNYQPSVNANKIVWTTFTANGYSLQEADKNAMNWQEISPEQFAGKLSNFGIDALDKTNAGLLSSVPHENLPVLKYHKAFGLLHFHSIEPLVDDPEYSLTLVSENILNTLQSQLSFTYNRSEQWKRIGFTSVYGALFPYLSAGVDYTIDRRGRYHNKTVYWNELEPHGGFNIPLNVSKGRSLTFLNIGSSYVYNQSNFKGVYKDTLGKISYSYISNFFRITNQIQKAKQNIYPRLAQTLSLGYKRALTNYDGSQFVADGNLYLPGFVTNHNIVFNGAYLKKDTIGQLNFSSGFPFSRGYQSENLHEMIKWGANYHLPLLYPDAGFASIVYFLRVRANLFYDHTHINDFFTNGTNFKANFRSTGAELFFDTKWWNEADVTFGIRYSYLFDKDLFGATGKNRWELILPVTIFNQ